MSLVSYRIEYEGSRKPVEVKLGTCGEDKYTAIISSGDVNLIKGMWLGAGNMLPSGVKEARIKGLFGDIYSKGIGSRGDSLDVEDIGFISVSNNAVIMSRVNSDTVPNIDGVNFEGGMITPEMLIKLNMTVEGINSLLEGVKLEGRVGDKEKPFGIYDLDDGGLISISSKKISDHDYIILRAYITLLIYSNKYCVVFLDVSKLRSSKEVATLVEGISRVSDNSYIHVYGKELLDEKVHIPIVDGCVKLKHFEV